MSIGTTSAYARVACVCARRLAPIFSDGQISKAEMKSYFLNLNSHSKDATIRRSFQHEFVETTFLTPVTCANCKKLVSKQSERKLLFALLQEKQNKKLTLCILQLWGVYRQGHKCANCGLIAHTQCKNVTVAACRRPMASTSTAAAASSASVATAAAPSTSRSSGSSASGTGSGGGGGISAWLTISRSSSTSTTTTVENGGGANARADSKDSNSSDGSMTSGAFNRGFRHAFFGGGGGGVGGILGADNSSGRGR